MATKTLGKRIMVEPYCQQNKKENYYFLNPMAIKPIRNMIIFEPYGY